MAQITGVNTKGLKILLTTLIAVGVFFGVKHFVLDAPKSVTQSSVAGKIILPDEPESSLSAEKAVKLELPTSKPFVSGDAVPLEVKIMAWNAQLSLMYANGDSITTKGSLMSKANVMLKFTRQDDCNKSCGDITAFANAYKAWSLDNSKPKPTAVGAIFMGDGMPGFLAGLWTELGKLGADYEPVIIPGFMPGASYGEDQLLAPIEWRTNPRAAIGKTVACVLRDGDMNILLKWAFDNNIKVNPDEKTFDSTAINLMAADDYLKSAEKYIAGYTEERTVVVNGKTTNRKVTVKADAVASWTPADVNISEQKGDLVSIVSTKEYSTQMPATFITVKKWANDNRQAVENMIVALAQAGDQVRSYTEAKEFGAKVSARAYGEHDAAYWLKYYNGVQGTKNDKDSHLGGSRSYNLMDMANMVGRGADNLDRYKATYNTFGSILLKMYPHELAGYPEYSKVVDKSFLSDVIENNPDLLEGKALQTTYAANTTTDISSKNYQIQFDNGSAVIKPESKQDLETMFNSAVVAEGLKIKISGHTDTKGNPESNLALSQQRADAVKAYLLSKHIAIERIESVGRGNEIPKGCLDTHNGDNQARRVVNVTLSE